MFQNQASNIINSSDMGYAKTLSFKKYYIFENIIFKTFSLSLNNL
jgi:hypothetical protein